MPKDEKYSTSSIADFFDFRFNSLPHKTWQKNEFIKGVDNLRDEYEHMLSDIISFHFISYHFIS